MKKFLFKDGKGDYGLNFKKITKDSLLPLGDTTNLVEGDNISLLTNDTGYITGITSGDVTIALGYTPENVSNKAIDLTVSNDTLYTTTKAVNDGLATKQDLLGYTAQNQATAYKYLGQLTGSDDIDVILTSDGVSGYYRIRTWEGETHPLNMPVGFVWESNTGTYTHLIYTNANTTQNVRVTDTAGNIWTKMRSGGAWKKNSSATKAEMIATFGYTPADTSLVVHKAGDTMTGDLSINNANLNLTPVEVTMTDKNAHYNVLTVAGEPLFRAQTKYLSSGSLLSGDDSYGIGKYALHYNTSNYCNGFGSYALQQNSGGSSNGFGYGALTYNSGQNGIGIGTSALRLNSGDDAIGIGSGAVESNTSRKVIGIGGNSMKLNTGYESLGFGHMAMYRNSGILANAIGNDAARENKGNYLCAFGHSSGEYNTGPLAIAIGINSGMYNTGDNNVLVGGHSGQYMDGYRNTIVGHYSYKDFIPDSSKTKTFTELEVDTENNLVTIASHGFGYAGDFVNLEYSGPGISPGHSINQWEIIDSNTIKSRSLYINSITAGTHSLTPAKKLTHVAILGTEIQPTRSHQTLLGGKSVAVPSATNTEIDSVGAKALITKEYFDANKGSDAPVPTTYTITASTTLTAEHNGHTLLCDGNITLTIPTGLGADFNVNIISIDETTDVIQMAAGAGVTLKAPHGTKLLAGYTCNLTKKTSVETFYLHGELTT